MPGMIFSGELSIKDPWDTGSFQVIGNATEFNPKINLETKRRISKGKVDYGRATQAVNVFAPSTVTFTVDDVSIDNLGLIYQDDSTPIATPAGQSGTWQRLSTGAESQKLVGLQLCGVDLISARAVIVTAPQMILTANSTPDILTEEFVTLQMSGLAVFVSGETADMYIDMQD